MPAWLTSLNVEMIAGGVVGLSMLGVIIRNAIYGWVEARAKLKESEKNLAPITAMSVSWDRDQIERALQLFERMAEALELQCQHSEAIAEAQGILSDNFQQTTQSKLDDLLKKLDAAVPKPRTKSSF